LRDKTLKVKVLARDHQTILSDFIRRRRYTFKRMTSDLDLLRQFVRENSQDAFTEIVRRHLNLIYSAAFRQVRSVQLAEEVAQSVFADLARDAGKLKPDTILTAWLYSVTRRTAIDAIRKESRRQLREQIAVDMTNMNATSADWTQIEPLLDDAMAALDETDRSAILLRYFENKNLREVGETLGTNEDAAQKRVSRAVERLREFFSKRNVSIGASGLAVLISANAVQSAPIGLVVMISSAAVLAGTAVHSLTVIAATKTIAMTTLQKSIIGMTFAVVVGTGIFEVHQNSKLQNQIQTLQQQQAPLAEQIQELQRERDDATNQLAGLLAENAQLKSNSNENELLKLRGEVAQLKNEANNPINAASKDWLTKVNKLKQRLDETPGAKIPELQYLTEKDWIDAAKDADLNTEGGIRRALSTLRYYAMREFAPQMVNPLAKYANATDGKLPDEISQLQPYFDPPADDAIFARYKMLRSGNVMGITSQADVMADTPVDELFDGQYYFWTFGYGNHFDHWQGDYRFSPNLHLPQDDPNYETPVP
jgi:RNA polymerase sigma factor (sigma-70 family)